MVRERLATIRATTRHDYLLPEIWFGIAQKREKQQWAVEKPKLDNAQKLRGIYFIDLDDGEFKAAMLCKLRTTKRPNRLLGTDSGTKEPNKIQKTKHACIVEAHESARKRLGSTPRSHRGERVQFAKSLRFGAQLCAYAPSDGREEGGEGRFNVLPRYRIVDDDLQ